MREHGQLINRALPAHLRARSLDRSRYDTRWALRRPDGVIRGWADMAIETSEHGAMIPLRRWIDGQQLAKDSGNPYLIFGRFGDNTYVARHDEVAEHLLGGRAELEPCIFIPIRMFDTSAMAKLSSERGAASSASCR